MRNVHLFFMLSLYQRGITKSTYYNEFTKNTIRLRSAATLRLPRLNLNPSILIQFNLIGSTVMAVHQFILRYEHDVNWPIITECDVNEL